MHNKEEYNKTIKKAERLAHYGLFTFALASVLLAFLVFDPSFSILKKDLETISDKTIVDDEDKIVNGIHIKTGFIDAEGLSVVINNCTNCHSAKLVTQNRMNADRWNATIKWMQETQNLWDLGDDQKIIVDYLVQNYPVIEKGRRDVLTNIEWYEIKE